MKCDTIYFAYACVGAVAITNPAVAQAQQASTISLPEIQISVTPVSTGNAGGIDIDRVPADVSIITAKAFAQRNSPSVTDAITARVPGAIAINVDGSDLSPDLFYRGFDASRIAGNKQGLAVYENGVRINEVFGDSVNLDLIPPIAVARAEVYTNNPIFGLNALGGAVNFQMKNGFTYKGGEASVYGGSYGRTNGVLQYGKQVGNYALYVALDGYRDSGYRPFGAQNAERGYADLGYRTQDSEVHLIGGYGRSRLGVQGVTPLVLVNQQYNSVFTTPQATTNQAGLAQLTGRVDVAPHWSLAGTLYIRQFDQNHIDGNDANVAECSTIGASPQFNGKLCGQAGGIATNPDANVLRDANGKTINFLGDTFPYGTTAHTATQSRSYGAELQATNTDRIFGHDNYFVFGGSADIGDAAFQSYTTLGQLNAQFQNIDLLNGLPGIGGVLQTQGRIGYSSVSVTSTTNYYGIFALDTFNITKQLAVTAGARANLAAITLTDQSGLDGALNTANSYNRINPVFGATYTIAPSLTVYGGYSESNRAPVPLESACSNPLRPCTLESSLVADPPLKQVVSRTIEAGGRGAIPVFGGAGLLSYKAAYFHTTLNDDILSVPSVFSGQGYFVNVPRTLRQGVEAGIEYDWEKWNFYANYAYIDATYRFSQMLSSPNNPSADANGNIRVNPGNQIPGIPRHLGKIGVEYHATSRFIIGGDAIFVGSQYYIGDNGNQQPQLPYYTVFNFHSSYQITNHVQVFGLINNILSNRYATFGTFFSPSTGGGLVNSILAANAALTAPDARAVTVAQPLSVYGGVRITF